MKKLINDEKASVSVFLIIISVSVIFLILGVINIYRYIMAEQIINESLYVTTQNTLSLYNKDLAREMGLFAVSENDISEEFVLNNIKDNIPKSSYFDFINIKNVNCSIDNNSLINSTEIIEKQIEKEYSDINIIGIADNILDYFGDDALNNYYNEEYLSEIDETNEIINKLKTISDNVYEKVSIVEYSLNTLDFKTLEPYYDRYYEDCEIEYLLNGYNFGFLNQESSILKIFALRFCINIIDEIKQGKIYDLDTFVIEAAAVAIKTSEEIDTLLTGEKIVLIPNTNIRFSYKDYLRLFLYLTDTEKLEERLINLTDKNLNYWQKDSSISNYGTVIELMAEYDINLWPIGNISKTKKAIAGYDKKFEIIK